MSLPGAMGDKMSGPDTGVASVHFEGASPEVVELLARLGLDPRSIESGSLSLEDSTWRRIAVILQRLRRAKTRFGAAIWLYQFCSERMAAGVTVAEVDAALADPTLWARLWAHPLSRVAFTALPDSQRWIRQLVPWLLAASPFAAVRDRFGVEVCSRLLSEITPGLSEAEIRERIAHSLGVNPSAAPHRLETPVRRWLRQGIRATLWGLVIGGAWLAGIEWWYWNLTPAEVIDLIGVYDEVVDRSPGEERAWPAYRPLLMEMSEGWRESSWLHPADLQAVCRQGPEHPQWKLVGRFLRQNRAAIDTAIEASQRRHLGFVYRDEDNAGWEGLIRPDRTSGYPYPVDDELLYVGQPYLGDLTWLARLLELQVRMRILDGDRGGAFQAFLARLGIARQLVEAPDFVAAGTQDAELAGEILRTSSKLLQLQEEWLTLDQYQQAAQELDRLPTAKLIDNFRRWQRISVIVDRWHAADAQGGRLLGPPLLNYHSALRPKLWSPPPQNMIWPFSDWGILQCELTWRAPFLSHTAARRAELQDLISRLASEADARRIATSWGQQAVASLPTVNLLTAKSNWEQRYGILWYLYLVSGDDLPQLHQRITSGCLREALQVQIALRAHRLRHGTWPSSLDELAPDEQVRFPSDPFTGKPLQYRLDSQGPRVWSVGSDEFDDTTAMLEEWTAGTPPPRPISPQDIAFEPALD